MTLSAAPTCDLVAELSRRAGVARCDVKPHHNYEVAVVADQDAYDDMRWKDAYEQGGMHSGEQAGPCIILVISD